MNNTDEANPNPEDRPIDPTSPPPIPPNNSSILNQDEASTAHKDEQSTANSSPKPRFIEWFQAITNAVLAIIGIIAICIYGSQLGAMKGQLKEMHDSGIDTHTLAQQAITQSTQTNNLIQQATTQAEAATKSANALIESNSISRESLQSVQRAFMVFDKIQVSKATVRLPAGNATQWNIWSTWQNSGTTAAPRTLKHFAHSILLVDEPTEEIFKGNVGDGTYGANFVGPKQSSDSGPIVEPESFFPTSPNSQFNLSQFHFFWGWVAYRDIFSGTPLHLTEFCQKLVSVTLSGDNIGMRTEDCRHHNCTDQYCSDFKIISDMARPMLSEPN